MAAALVGVLARRVRAETSALTRLRRALQADDGAGVPLAAPRAAARRTRALGWALGLLAHGLGSPLEPRRSDPLGVELTLELVREALQERGLVLRAVARGSPLRGGASWSVCWTLAEALWCAAASHGAGALEVDLAADGGGLRLQATAAIGAPLARLAARLGLDGGGARLVACGGGWQLDIGAAPEGGAAG